MARDKGRKPVTTFLPRRTQAGTDLGVELTSDLEARVAALEANVLTPADIADVGYWSPMTNGDGVDPEIVFDSNGDTIMVFTPTP